MPADGTAMGLVHFVGVKFVGYTPAASAMRRTYQKPESNIWKVRILRALIGLGVLAAYGKIRRLAYSDAPRGHDPNVVPCLSGFLPVRGRTFWTLPESLRQGWFLADCGFANPNQGLQNTKIDNENTRFQ